ncbi:MAG: energy-coupling factor transporter ATPase, partial [Oscillospiraceae bacterium]|nr:energy-coupling factor transporter ATPase [Oscillospiraceae bacterium]
DPRGRKEVMETVQMLNRDFGITVLFITHYMDEAVKANRVIVMDEGNILLDGTPREVFANVEILKSCGLDVPEATELSRLLRSSGVRLRPDILDIDELFQSLTEILEEKN